MFYKLPYKLSLNIMICIFSLILVFHLLVLMQIIPYTIVWAGKLNSVTEMRNFESVSILLNLLMLLVILVKADYVKWRINQRILNSIMWTFVVLFSLNTIGNLFSKSTFELIVFTPLTFLMAVLCLRIVLEK